MTSQTHDRDASTQTALITIEGAFKKMQAEPGADTLPWLQTLQDKAFKIFQKTGFPNIKDEDWKYTNLTGFTERSATYLQNQPSSNSNDDIEALLDKLPKIDGEILIVFINGLHRPDLSTTADPATGIKLMPYSSIDASTGEQIFHQQPINQNTMIALNTAFLTDGLAIHVAENIQIDAPIHVVFASDGLPVAAQPHLTINIGQNAEALIVQHHISTGESLTNAVTEITCAEHARLFFIRLQNESEQSMHVANQIVRLAKNSHFDSISIDIGSQLARNDLNIDLHGEHAHASLHGLFMSNGNRHVDNHLRVDHRAPHTTSLEHYRGILSDTARGVFNGKIIVHSGADGTDAQMNNRNLLLGERAEINTKPELEIYTDDVKCAHGATTGQLDQNAMFYLQARGVPQETARMMLVGAFAQEIIALIRSRIPALADHLDTIMGKQLPENV